MVLWTRNRSTEKKKKPQWFTYSVEVRGKISEKDRIELYRKNRNHLGNNWCLNYNNGEITANNRGYVYFFFIRHNGTYRAISGDITNSIMYRFALDQHWRNWRNCTLLFTSKISWSTNARSRIENHRCWNQISPMCAGYPLVMSK